MNAVEKRISRRIGEAWVGAAPGFVLQVHAGGKRKADLAFGETYPYYDWASLTKIVFSVTQAMSLVDQGLIDVEREVAAEIDWFRAPVKRARVRELLCHSAGLTWWKPFYESIDRSKPRAARWAQLELLVAEEMKAAEKAGYDGRAVYSDLDFFALGALMKRKTGRDFDKMWDELRDRFGLRETTFHVGNKPTRARRLYAPTETCPWREKTIQGEVHDENAWALGGVAPHAGLFGPLDDLSRWGLLLRASLRGGKGLAEPGTVRSFARRALPRARGDWALGFMMPSSRNPSCGRYFSKRSVGHLGFTGTSLWYDPRADLLVTILSNRVHPTRENKLFPQLRGFLHNCVIESL